MTNNPWGSIKTTVSFSETAVPLRVRYYCCSDDDK